MISPDGGATHAYTASEIKTLEGYGWRVEEPTADSESPTVVQVDEVVALAEVAEEVEPEFNPDTDPAPAPKKRGRPAKV